MSISFEITPPRLFVIVVTIITFVLWSLGLCGKLAEAMHAQAMEYNEVYTGEDHDEEDAEEDSKLPQLKKRQKAA